MIAREIFYTGKQWDEDAELYYFNARWYDAGTGRFITEDPARNGLAWYAYCNNNPMTYIDPTGMWRTRAERKQDRADNARENGNTERADRLEKQAEAARMQQERIEQLPDGYSGINGLSKQGEPNQYPEAPSVNDLLSDESLTDAEKEKLLEEFAQASTILSEGIKGLEELGVPPSTIGVLGPVSRRVSDVATLGLIYTNTRDLMDAINAGDTLQIIDNSANLLTHTTGLLNPMAGAVTEVYAEATVTAIEVSVDVNTYAQRDPIGFMSSLNDLFGSSYNVPWGR